MADNDKPSDDPVGKDKEPPREDSKKKPDEQGEDRVRRHSDPAELVDDYMRMDRSVRRMAPDEAFHELADDLIREQLRRRRGKGRDDDEGTIDLGPKLRKDD